MRASPWWARTVSSHGHGTLIDALLGSVSRHALLHHAECPVAVVHG